MYPSISQELNMQTIARRTPPVNSLCGSRRHLTDANARLHALRQAHQAQMQPNQSAVVRSFVQAQRATDVAQPVANVTLHAADGFCATDVPQKKSAFQIEIEPDVDAEPTSSIHVQTLTVQPSLLVAFLKNEVAAIGRIWLLCRHLDQSGRGWLNVDELRTQLTTKNSPYYVCGWRRLRQIMQAGMQTFWQRDDVGRLWLFGTIKVAANLALTRFSGDAVELPVRDLVGSIGAVRAAFYATFHCGRASAPIARATLQTITGIPERTQRHYDDTADTVRVSNFSLVAPVGDEDTLWQHGRAAFPFIDKQGKHGAVNQHYTAIRLPNSYNSVRYAPLKRKRRRLNRRLKQILVQRGTQGNGDGQVQRLFFSDGKQAARVFGRNNDTYLYDQHSNNVVFWTGWLH